MAGRVQQLPECQAGSGQLSYRLYAAGRLKSAEAELYERYARRLGNRLQLTEVAETPPDRLTCKLQDRPATLALVALDERGELWSTAQLHDWLAARGYAAAFVIGAADGLPPALRAQADLTLALGRMTWPHQLARVLLVEQLYRVECIRQGHPYHRSG